MARKQDPVPRLSDVRADYEDALQNYMLKAGMLSAEVDNVLSLDEDMKTINPVFRKRLEAALAAYRAA